MKVDNSKNKLKYWLPLIIFGIIIAAINFVSIIFTRNIDLKLATIGISIIAILLFLRFPRIRIILGFNYQVQQRVNN
jgi:hypothetical protein